MSITLGTEQKEINLVQFVPDRDMPLRRLYSEENRKS